MAASSVRCLRQLLRPNSPLKPCFRNLMTKPEPMHKKYMTQAVIFALGAGSAMILYHSAPRLIAVTPKGRKEGEGGSVAKLTSRERRFMKFASVQYEGQLYMTPQDFLESVTEAEPRPRLKRLELTKKEVSQLLNNTPPVRKSTPHLFRNLKDKGIISYTEYLFLLSILTKPQTGFRIAFNMFDTDNNQKVDKHEFLVLQIILAKYYWKEKKHRHPRFGGKVEVLERIFSYARRAREKAKQEKNAGRNSESSRETEEALDEILYSENVNDTTLMVHFFGMKGNGYLGYEDFHRFMDNLQTEVLQLEFNEFSRGQPTISEMDFAKILLRYTLLHADDYDDYIQHLATRIPNQKGITFDEYKTFCQFLNNLDDFAIAMRMYTYADQPISQEEFIRAVRISMGRGLGEHLVNTVFQIFDENNDGQLSYKDFIAIMRDRLHRGIKKRRFIDLKSKTGDTAPIQSHLQKHEGWDAFKACIKEEMKASV